MKARRRLHFKRIGLEAGPLSQWLYSVLAEAGLPVICVETRHMRAVLKAQINKTDRNDARGIAQMMRVGLYRPVHVKTLRSQKLRMLLTHRKLLQSKAIAVENDLRASLRNFGLKVGMIGTVKFEARIRELVENLPDLAVLVEPLLTVRRVLREQLGILHRRVLAVVRDDDVVPAPDDDSRCRPCGRADLSRHRRCAGPLQELQGSRSSVWTDAVQVSIRPERSNRRNIAVWRRDDAGDALRSGPEHAGAFDEMVLAQGLGDEDRIVALARRLAVIMHRIWVDGTDSGGPGRSPQHENCTASNQIRENLMVKRGGTLIVPTAPRDLRVLRQSPF